MKLRTRRIALIVVSIAGICLVGAELVARYYLGLGDPPLTILDPQIEYLFAPDQDRRRFGNRVHYNQFSMRSDDFPQRKTDPNEFRVLFIGDSIINGGAQTDQSQLATERIRDRLAGDLKRPVTVGNISAGSWGPSNQLAYVERYGLFDADVVVVVVSSHDYADVPTFSGELGADFPTRTPPLALWEAATRYLPRYLSPAKPATVPPPPPSEADVQRATGDLKTLLARAKASGATVIVGYHLERDEPRDVESTAGAALRGCAEAAGVPIVPLGRALTSDMYRDAIHPDVRGQHAIADALYPAIRDARNDDDEQQQSGG